ncbi:hypothetical protein vBRpoPV13_75 [Ruegeria phage vB_RpoP-V13]|jgi:hypothetical protein|uniref:Uncharacterized protein n=1 Tax=Ruegeria phage vB_RpoP-V13 TaxID=2218612 RepID=A0A2Z4QGL5_9CAUD|nr:hypothetical protein HYP63_gp75 [Ruegeria phage vB_RpoP-V13]AWY09432.1 hypothetical protein vBRpoPV13_75 [Ruegeria phage vB_RpoP-V13]
MDQCWTYLSFLGSISMVLILAIALGGSKESFPLQSRAAFVRKWYEESGGLR